MFDVGWSELLVIGALALIVVGPRDLPQLLRTVGQFVGKVKRMGREFQRSLEDAARESNVADFKELRDLKKEMGSNLNFRDQASRAQSYLKKPVQPAKPETKSAAKAGAPGEPTIEKPAAAAPEASEPQAPTEAAAAPEPSQPEPRQAAKG